LFCRFTISGKADMKRYVSYLRVSTTKQGASGLGLEAQRAAVIAHANGNSSIISEFIEIESGKKDERNQLAAAISYAKQHSATLLIAKLDRLSRNAAFIFTLKDSGIDFTCADMPDANTLTIGIFAVLAQHERELISSRTKAALAAKKNRGETLGSPANLTAAARNKGVEAIKANAASAKENVQARQLIDLLSGQGLTLAQIAEKLNQSGYRTRKGGLFHPMSVSRLQTKKEG
jgi:DNA invertase Pin-like site-specific DNA recombinase